MFFGAEITGIGIFRHLKTLIRKQPLVVFRPILCKRSLVHFHGLCGNGELDCHRIGVSHIQCLLILYHVTVFEHQFLHFGILIRFLEDDVSVYRLVLLEHFIQHNGIGSRFDFHIDCLVAIPVRRANAMISIIPVLLIACLILCPVFINITAYVPRSEERRVRERV